MPQGNPILSIPGLGDVLAACETFTAPPTLVAVLFFQNTSNLTEFAGGFGLVRLSPGDTRTMTISALTIGGTTGTTNSGSTGSTQVTAGFTEASKAVLIFGTAAVVTSNTCGFAAQAFVS
jgi:hypothetical protein